MLKTDGFPGIIPKSEKADLLGTGPGAPFEVGAEAEGGAHSRDRVRQKTYF